MVLSNVSTNWMKIFVFISSIVTATGEEIKNIIAEIEVIEKTPKRGIYQATYGWAIE
jgi:hypothetical protein